MKTLKNNGAAVRNSFINEFVFGDKDQALRNLIAEARKSSALDDITDAYIISQLASQCAGRLSDAHTSQTAAIA